ncbi:hypothetical protein SUGI_0400720 [Cryptomeria japonica]|nr:hypothetical protein SUGI_0400720 [Cryptomeria japonica]
MESYLKLISAKDNKLMAFKGSVKEERWFRILNELDNLSVRAVQVIMGEEVYNYDHIYRGDMNRHRG